MMEREQIRFSLGRAWMSVVTSASVIYLAMIFFNTVLQLVIHLAGCFFSESYRHHMEPFGGCNDYIQAQIFPRIIHSITLFHWKRLVIGSVVGLSIYILYAYVQDRSTRIVWALVIFVGVVGWYQGRMLVLDPFWSIIELVNLLVSIYFAYAINQRLKLLS